MKCLPRFSLVIDGFRQNTGKCPQKEQPNPTFSHKIFATKSQRVSQLTHVWPCSRHGEHGTTFSDNARHIEVCQVHVALRVQEQVSRLDVTMDDHLAPKVLNRQGTLGHVQLDSVDRKPPLFIQMVANVSAYRGDGESSN